MMRNFPAAKKVPMAFHFTLKLGGYCSYCVDGLIIQGIKIQKFGYKIKESEKHPHFVTSNSDVSNCVELS